MAMGGHHHLGYGSGLPERSLEQGVTSGSRVPVRHLAEPERPVTWLSGWKADALAIQPVCVAPAPTSRLLLGRPLRGSRDIHTLVSVLL